MMQTGIDECFQHVSGSKKFNCVNLANINPSKVIAKILLALERDKKHKIYDIESIVVRHCHLTKSDLKYYHAISNVCEHLDTAIFSDLDVDIIEAEKLINNLHDKPLKTLVFNEYWLGGEKKLSTFLKSISANQYVKSLDLSLDWLGDEGIALLAHHLSQMKYLTHLDISCNDFNRIGLEYLVQSTIKHPSLSSLNLSYNHIPADGAVFIEALLKNNDVITELDLQSNHLQDNSVNYLIRGLEDNHSLKKLNVGDNQISGRVLKRLVKAAIKNENIEQLNISYNRIDENIKDELVELIDNNFSTLRMII
ncbi:MAG: hypothetical protein KIT56_10830 [Gammaproteobacteria bacterium]|nr:hypothetical protein [Gammaproteobacteria bacterium]MCW5584339.1 hypothetical protein [Gammaproteobacteria bacterium]